jgi:hypothetical protein
MDKPDGDGSLMAEIAPQAQHPYGLHNGELGLKVRRIADFQRAIIHQQDIESTRVRGNGPVQAADELRGGRPVVPERHENYNMQRRR